MSKRDIRRGRAGEASGLGGIGQKFGDAARFDSLLSLVWAASAREFAGKHRIRRHGLTELRGFLGEVRHSEAIQYPRDFVRVT
jgi:hypothetical protein